MPDREASRPPQTARALVVVAGGRTDVGRLRTLNEDSYLVAALGRDAVVMKGATTTITIPQTPGLLVVADGVGGAASGEIASLMATDTMFIELRRRFESDWPRTAAGVDAALRSAISAANHVIFTYAAGNPQHRGMATTSTLAVVHESTITIAQVGDSRAYLVRGGVARQITKDQSLIQRLIDAGEMTEGEAANSDRRNIILQALGSEATVSPDMYREQAEAGDVLMLCSDGLSNLVSPTDIARIALADDNMETVCERLVGFANSLGGHDNITVVAARFEPGEPVDPDRPPPATTRESTSPGLSDRVRRWLR
ncbi:MAG: protein phosphatase 2C domain-containing protein [Gemmatimonadota bacterium]|nr:protein phosphatase 2C domain-containing protein [Gemmatimonadota bacterium]